MAGSGTMNPSTFQQVRENMEAIFKFLGSLDPGTEIPSISDIVDRLEKLEEDLNNIIENPGGGGDTSVEEDGSIKVYGVSLVTEFADENLTPAAYTRDVTFELKKPSVVGLNSFTGFEEDKYSLVVTYKHNLVKNELVDSLDYCAQQMAFGAKMIQYARTASDTSQEATWGPWAAVVPEAAKAEKQFIQSDTEPENQPEGDYWCEPIKS